MNREYAAQWWMAVLYLGIVAASILTSVAYITINRVGPRWFWSSDVCPEANVTCGVVPMGLILVCFIGGVFLSYGVRALPEPGV